MKLNLSDSNLTKVIQLGLALGAVLTLTDVIFDLYEQVPLSHVLHEILLILLFVITILTQRQLLKRQKKTLIEKSQTIERMLWNQQLRSDFQQTIREQFRKWHFSESETEIAVLLIKGFSMKEIAEFRQSKEATVRQQAASIYRKSGIEGRQQLSAYFLEDLF